MTGKFIYQKGYEIHKYGESNRLPADQLLVKQINRVMDDYPDYRVALPGTSGVHGETFPLFRTQCEFTLESEEAVEMCLAALKERDEFNRARNEVLWTWEMVITKGTSVIFWVNWLDFAYFMQSKDAFLGAAHAEYTNSFGLNPSAIKYAHMRLDEHGNESLFNETSLSDEENLIVSNLASISFDRSFKDRS